jgi:hypothetical protein
MLTALEILTAFIKQDANTDDIDRMIAMSAYMAKKLEADMLKPIEQLEAEVWPELVTTGSEAHDPVL